jgi:hypothetical protein
MTKLVFILQVEDRQRIFFSFTTEDLYVVVCVAILRLLLIFQMVYMMAVLEVMKQR